MKLLHRYVLHPFLLGLLPVLAIHAANLGQVEPNVSLRALAVSFVFAGIVTTFAYWLTRDRYTAGLLASASLLLFFSYGHIYSIFEGYAIVGILIGRHRFLVLFYLALWSTLIYFAVHMKDRAQSFNGPLNFILLGLVLVSLLQINLFNLSEWRSQSTGGNDLDLESYYPIGDESNETPPDIYYIILDAYAREDVLAQYYDFSNRSFLEDLEQLGFYVADCSQSNYAQTELSLASSLNFSYLSDLGENFERENTDRSPLRHLIRKSEVRRILEERGFEIIAFETGFYWSQWMDADIYLTPHTGQLDLMRIRGGLSNFEALLLRSTASILVFDGFGIVADLNQPIFQQLDWIQHERVLFTLGQLDNLHLTTDRPKFVFAHIVAPHPPYVFEADGDFVNYDRDLIESDPALEIHAYREQVQFINESILGIVKKIIENADRPPIIIIQADHGPGSQGREDKMKILNAYFLPLSSRDQLYPSISPVNTFTVVLNALFELNLPLNDDISYYSSYPYAYDFQETPANCLSNP